MKKILKITALIIVVLIVASLLFAYFFLGDLFNLSADQMKITGEFGFPDTFLISMDANNRFEVWSYYDLETSFSFLNGEFNGDQPIRDLEGGFEFPKFRPLQFTADMDLGDIKKIFKGEPTAEGILNPEIMDNVTIYDYFDQIKVGIQDDKVIFIQTLPVPQ